MAEDSRVTALRGHFPEFANTTAYAEAVILFWYGIAEKQVIQDRWGDMYTHGLELATAHYVTLAKRNAIKPGDAGGVVSSKGVGDISVSYDSQAGTEKDGAQWNLTWYGREFLRLARMLGMGGMQL